MDLVALCSGYGGRQRVTAAMAVFVGKERPHFSVVQAGFAKAHVRFDVGCIEVDPQPSSASHHSAYPLIV